MKIFWIRLAQGLWYLFATAIILSAVLVAAARLATPLLDKHHHDIEAWASQLLLVPVTIQKVQADWHGYTAEFSMQQVVTRDRETKAPVFEIREIKVGFRPLASLWEQRIVLQNISITGAHVTVLQDANGQLSIKDLPIQKDEGLKSYQLTTVLAWIFSQHFLALHNIEVDYLPYKGEARDLSLEKITLWNDGDNHRLSGNFILHQDIPTEVKSHIEWTGSVEKLARTQGHAYFKLEGFSLAQWLRNKEPTTGFLSGWQIHRGLGGADIWMDWERGQLQQVQSIFQWYDLEFYSLYDQKTYPLQHVSGHVGWKREGEKQIFAGDNLLLDFPEHLWPATTFYVVLAPENEGDKTSFLLTSSETKALPVKHPQRYHPKPSVVSSDKLNIDGLLHELEAAAGSRQDLRLRELRFGFIDMEDVLPLILANARIPPEVRKSLLDINPRGDLLNLVLNWEGKGYTDLSELSFSGATKSLSFHPWHAFPGITNLSAKFLWNGKTGNAQIDSTGLAFTLHSLFAEPLVFDKVRAFISVQQDKTGAWSFSTMDAEAKNAEAEGKAIVQMLFPVKGSPSIDLRGEFSLTNALRVTRYLPTGIMDADLVEWLGTAFLNGRLEGGKLSLSGKLSDFPFDDKKGHFDISGNLQDIDFHYAPQWPLIRQAQGFLKYSGRALTVRIDSATILDIPLRQITAEIPYIGADKPQILEVQGEIQSNLASGLNFIHHSPLENTVGKDLEELELEGPVDLALSLTIPLKNPTKSKISGEAQVKNAKLILPEWNLSLDEIAGSFHFSERELSSPKLLGKLWGEPTILQLSTFPAKRGLPAYIQAKLTGRVDLAKMEKEMNLSLSRFLSGSTAYQARLKLYESDSVSNELLLSSKLQGITVDLPQPYDKGPLLKRDLSLNLSIQPNAQIVAQVKYGDLIQAKLKFAIENNFRLIDIDSPPVKGRVKISYPFEESQPIQAQLDSLLITPNNGKTIASISPRSLPPLYITAKQFTLGEKNLGQLTLNTQPRSNGLQIQNFNLSAPDYVFKSQGSWTEVGPNQNSQLQGSVESGMVKRFLDRMGVHLGSLIVNKGRASFSLQWKGPPYSFSLANATGNFSFNLEKGRIIDLNQSSNNKMDIGRMLSVFSLQTIPRRLSLDFSDLVEQGYSFDYIRADFSLRQGNAYTQKDAVIDGPVAHVTARGRIGLLKEDYDLSLSVSPYVTESLPVVAGAITLNPLVGAAAWLVNKMVLSKEVSKAITYNYTVTGPWSAPVWQSARSNPTR